MIKYYCDRCRREIKVYVNVDVYAQDNSKMVYHCMLCRDCSDSFRELIEVPQRGDIAWSDRQTIPECDT